MGWLKLLAQWLACKFACRIAHPMGVHWDHSAWLGVNSWWRLKSLLGEMIHTRCRGLIAGKDGYVISIVVIVLIQVISVLQDSELCRWIGCNC